MGQTFRGEIGRTVEESTPWWPAQERLPEGAPNIVVILLDDTGFAQLGSFGSPVETPNFDRVAERGLRLTNFHTTALCSPSRACLLTGRNHHSVGMRALSNFDTGYPNMRGEIAPTAGTIAEVLGPKGYSTFCVGKWHLAPMRDATAAGPFTNWPLQRGFDRFYGFLQGETDHFHPELCEDNHFVDPPGRPEDGYHLSEDLVDRAIDMIHSQKSVVPEKPFFCYLAFGATHAPHQAPDEYLAKYRGRFDEGWDVERERTYRRQLELGVIPSGTELAPWNPGVKPWDELSSDEQALAARLQEAFAAFLDHTDAQVGRLLDVLDDLDISDDTLIMITSDNGASQEGHQTGVIDEFKFFNGWPEDVAAANARLDDIGTRRSFTNYPWGWAQVGNTPAKRYKQNTHGGGVRDPLIVSWPVRIGVEHQGGFRRQFHHIIDLAPTIYELVGVEPPESVKGVEQQAIEGTSMAYLLRDPDAATRKEHQYFEMFGHRGIWSNGWKAVTWHKPGTSLDEDTWELYHLDEDFSECHDLAAAEPEKLEEMIDLFWSEAETHGVLPIDGGPLNRLFGGPVRPGTPRARDTFVYRPPMDRVPSDTSPPFGSRSWELRATIERTANQNGVLLATGTVNNGLVVYLDDGHLIYDHNCFTDHTVVRSPRPVPAGTIVVGVDQTRIKQGPATARLWVAGEPVAEGLIPRVPVMISSVGMDAGTNPSGISDAYDAPFTFEGRIARLEVTTIAALDPEDEAAHELRAALGIQ